METKQQDHHVINQIIGQAPSWMLRWGILLVLLFFILLSILTWLIQYPDVIRAKTHLHTRILPSHIQMPVKGQIDSVFIKQGQTVKQGDRLAMLQSTAQLSDIQLVESFLFKKNTLSAKQTSPPSADLQLGSIGPHWSRYLLHQKELAFFDNNNIAPLKHKSIQQQIAKLEELDSELVKQKETFRAALKLAQETKTRDEQLFAEDAANIMEVEQSANRYLQAQQALERHSNSIIRNQLQIERLRSEILEVDYTQKKATSSAQIQVEKDRQDIQTAIASWKQAHLIHAPISGTVYVMETWTKGENLLAETPLFFVLPETASDNKIMATAILSHTRFGKIEKGAGVTIQLDAYPYQEFGVLEGFVERIPVMPEDGVYKIKISLQQPLITTYQHTIPFRQGLEGTAKITTQKRRLAERFFDRILNAWKN